MASAMFTNALKSFSSPIASNYHEKSASPIGYCGPWKIYDAKKKKTNQPVSIFVFERKTLETGRGGSRGDGLKAAQDEAVERLKKEASLLARLRHPCILELVEPVEETRSGGLQFVTEHVTASLTTLLQEKDDEERSGSQRRHREFEIDELEIQKGLLQIGKALEFLHESANLIHCNLTPDAIIVNAKSDWKLCGLGFAVPSLNPPLPPEFDNRLPANVQLSLDYAAPDLIIDSTLSNSCDLFSLGVLIVTLYNFPHKSPIESHHSNATYRKVMASPQTIPSANNNYLSARPVPRQLTGSVLPQLITRRPAGRMTARDFQQSEYFDNILVSTLRFLDQFPAKTPSEKSAFMRGLPKILPQFPRSVLEKKILPGLVEELRDGSLVALILPNIFQIIEPASSRLYSEKVLKRVKEVFLPSGSAPTSTSEPKTAAAKIAERERESGREGGLTVILSKMHIIKEKTTALEFKEDVLPLVFLALDSPTHAVQDMALRCLPVILPKLDFPTLKNDLFPVVATVFTKTSSLGIKIRGLEAFRVLCGGQGGDNTVSDGLDGFSSGSANGKKVKEEAPVLDKYTIQEKVIPLLKGIKTKEPAVMMETLSVFNEIGQICDREVVAMDILPTLWTMSFGPLLGLEQFKSFMSTIRALSSKIEAEQTRKLQEISTSHPSGHQTAGEFLAFGAAPGMNRATSPGDDDFERLVYGKKESQAPVDASGWPIAQPTQPANGNSSVSGASRSSSGYGASMGMGTNTSSNSTSTMGATLAPQVTTPRSRSPPVLTTSGAPKFSWSTPSPTNQIPPQNQSLNSVLSSSSASSTPKFTPAASPMNFSQPLQPTPGFGSTTAMRPTPSPATSNVVDWSAAMKPTMANTANRPVSTPPVAQPILNPQVMAQTLHQSQTMGAMGGMNSMNTMNTMGSMNTMNTMNTMSSMSGMPQMPQQTNQMTLGLNLGSGHTGIKKGGGIQLTNFGAPASSSTGTGTFGGMGIQTTTTTMNQGIGSMNTRNSTGMNMGMNMGMGMGMGMNTMNTMAPMAPKKEEKTGLDKWESLL